MRMILNSSCVKDFFRDVVMLAPDRVDGQVRDAHEDGLPRGSEASNRSLRIAFQPRSPLGVSEVAFDDSRVRDTQPDDEGIALLCFGKLIDCCGIKEYAASYRS